MTVPKFGHIVLLFALLLFVAGCEGNIPEPGPVVPEDAPVIGVTRCGISETTMGYYRKCLHDAGAEVVFFQYYAQTDSLAKAYVSQVDGIIIPGSFSKDSSYRASCDNRIIREALDKGKPLLGICYGHQRISTVLGGKTTAVSTLAPNSKVLHKNVDDKGTNVGLLSEAHSIHITPGSLLATLLRDTVVMVNTSHNYAVEKLGKGLTATARADDGIMEAFEGTNILGVQFHPEYLYGKMGKERFLPIFKNLRDQAALARASR